MSFRHYSEFSVYLTNTNVKNQVLKLLDGLICHNFVWNVEIKFRVTASWQYLRDKKSWQIYPPNVSHYKNSKYQTYVWIKRLNFRRFFCRTFFPNFCLSIFFKEGWKQSYVLTFKNFYVGQYFPGRVTTWKIPFLGLF